MLGQDCYCRKRGRFEQLQAPGFPIVPSSWRYLFCCLHGTQEYKTHILRSSGDPHRWPCWFEKTAQTTSQRRTEAGKTILIPRLQVGRGLYLHVDPRRSFQMVGSPIIPHRRRFPSGSSYNEFCQGSTVSAADDARLRPPPIVWDRRRSQLCVS